MNGHTKLYKRKGAFMNYVKEFFGNLSFFQKKVGEHLEGEKVKPKSKINSLLIIGVILLSVVTMCIFLFISNKKTTNNYYLNNDTSKYNTKNVVAKEKIESNNTEKKANKTRIQRTEEVLADFNEWLTSFKNKQVVLEINKEELARPMTEEVPGKLKQELVSNLINTFRNTVNESYENILQRTYSSHHIAIDSEQGLTIYNQLEEAETWLNTWYLDIEINKQNQKIILLNDFPFEWIDWREDVRHRETYKTLFNTIDWENDYSYEVIGVDLTHANKHLVSPSIVFILMKYDENLGKWQLTNEIGGIM